MKRVLALAALFALLLCGCSAGKYKAVSVSKETFLYAEEEEKYNLYFALKDESGQEIAAPAKVTLRIEDEMGNVLYKGKHSIKPEDYGHYDISAPTDHLLAKVTIQKSELTPGKSTSGKVFFNVSRWFSFSFKDLKCQASSCFPVQDIHFHCAQLGQPVPVRDPFWHAMAQYQVDELTWKADKYTGGTGELKVEGLTVERPVGTGMDMIRYEVTDQKGEKVQGGELYLGNFKEGDVFNATISFYTLMPGDEYDIAFMDPNPRKN